MISSADPASPARGQLPLTMDVEAPAPRNSRRQDWLILILIACAISATAFLHYWHTGEVLLYGDAVAHMNIARRVIDSRTPGLLQLGTVWLPLPHVLMLPFIGSAWMWRTGVAGAIPSMLAYVIGTVGVYRLVRNGLLFLAGDRPEATVSAWFAALVYALNPNLLYLQATAMTETIYLACFVWSTVYLSEFGQQLYRGNDETARKRLLCCGIFLCLGALTRYDGWFTAAGYGVAALLLLVQASRRSGLRWLFFAGDRSWRRAVLGFAATLAITPALWFSYNATVFGSPLAFAIGPYSARGIEEKTSKPGDPHHPGWNAPGVGAAYFLESAKMNVAASEPAERWWLYAALFASVMLGGFFRPLSPWLLLWAPVPFYAISIAWGGVPIFIPKWWPYSYYNVRYGTQLIPVFAVFGSLLLYLFLQRFTGITMKRVIASAAVLFLAWSCYGVWQATPVCLREAQVNSADRMAIESKLASELSKLSPQATVLMYMGEHGGALQRIGFPLKRTLNEGNYRYWGSALMSPASMADYLVVTEGDPLWKALEKHPEGVIKVAEITSPHQNRITVLRSTFPR